MTNHICILAGAFLASFIQSTPAVAQESTAGVHSPAARSQAAFSLTEGDGQIEVRLGDQSVTTFTYRHGQIKRPFFAHVKTPSGIQVTRNFPPLEGVDRTDHPDMHPGIWMAFARLNGISFWHNDGAVVHDEFVEGPVDGEHAAFTSSSRYVDRDGVVLCRQQTSYRITRDPAGYVIDMGATLSSDTPFYFGVREENGLGIRVAAPLTVAAGGTIVNSAGDRDEKGTWGKIADWWDYSGEIDGRKVGMMIMSAPDNPDLWAHSRDYGLIVANPFPVDREENRNLRVSFNPGTKLQLRYGVLVHENQLAAELDRDQAYRRYVDLISQTP